MGLTNLLTLFVLYASSGCITCITTGHPFPCGTNTNVTCARKGFDRCIKPPLIGDEDTPYCLFCDKLDAKCGTYEEIPDCNLYCHGVILEKESKKCDEGLHDDNARFYIPRKTFNIALVLCAAMTTGLVSLGVYTCCLQRKIRRANDAHVDFSIITEKPEIPEDDPTTEYIPLCPEGVISADTEDALAAGDSHDARQRPDFTAMPPTGIDKSLFVPS